ncbi:DUF3397 domain-containing protein [Bacillus sp. B1-b2]|uniref:DUF3397 domain-containing protein n=1 Tax=Bacillus sp. B1-b2 TaxID=2653201 RepID=UPI001261620C|nr:DUF3397 domain-containing protein [Bacillus sp. B1-b2]KAB7669274.1 DUF3397 domain-containing protein [Bacillus sp. B1-b2]
MLNFTSNLLSFFVVFPIFMLFFIFVISKMITKKQRFSIQLSIDISTIFFVFAVHFIVKEISTIHLLPYVIIFLLIVASILTIVQYNIKKEIKVRKIIKGVWRLTFLLFFPFYLISMVYGLISSIMSSLG